MSGNTLLFTLLVLLGACSPRPKSPQAPPDEIFLSEVQVDSLRNLDNRTITRSLWRAINPGRDSADLPVIHWLSGNLDKDEEPEAIVWYVEDNQMGTAEWLDRQEGRWRILTEIDALDFWHGENPPRIDPDLPALIGYSYGWGSGFSSHSLQFWQYRDSLVEVMNMIEQEGLSLMGGPGFRTIDGSYRLSGDSIVVHYTYEVICTEEGEHYEDRAFHDELDLLYLWNREKGLFEVQPPPGLSAADFGPYWDGESTLDPFFSPKLEQIRRKGPKWKRQTLGYWGDE